jgi:exodeoxyribonuclease VIII
MPRDKKMPRKPAPDGPPPITRELFLKLVLAAGAAPLPSVGFHSGVPMDHYLRIPAVANSWLGRFQVAPAKLYAALTEPTKAAKPETAATILGTAIHTAILEPDLFKTTYLRAANCTAVLASGNRKGMPCGNAGKYFGSEEGWRCGQHKPLQYQSGKIALSESEWECCIGLRDNCLSRKAQFHNPQARKLLTLKDSDVELTGLWKDPITGEPAKLRADHLADSAGASTDVKSTLDASPMAFYKTVYDRRYYAQQSHYSMGYDELRRPMRHYYLVAAEKEYPYLVAVYRIIDTVIDLGRKEVRQLLDLYHRCMETGEWPGYPAKIMDIGLPTWGERQLRSAVTLET